MSSRVLNKASTRSSALILLLFVCHITISGLVLAEEDVVEKWDPNNNSTNENKWKESYGLLFSYDPAAENGPHSWPDVDVGTSEFYNYVDHELHNLKIRGNECGAQLRQSPINLHGRNVKCNDTHEMLTRRIEDTDCKFEDLEFVMTPHGLKAYMPPNDEWCERPVIDVSNGFPYDWILHWIEVHIPAEHLIDGRKYDAEVQFVHFGLNASNHNALIVSMMLDGSSEYDAGEFQNLLDAWQDVHDATEERCSNYTNSTLNETTTARSSKARFMRNSGGTNEARTSQKRRSVDETFGGKRRGLVRQEQQPWRDKDYKEGDCFPDPNDNTTCFILSRRRKMFPYNLWPTIHYYRYTGSLTYPPCSKMAHWRVLDDPLVISRRQLRQLAKLQNSYKGKDCKLNTAASPKGETARPLQEVQKNHRVVHCTEDDFSYLLFPPSMV